MKVRVRMIVGRVSLKSKKKETYFFVKVFFLFFQNFFMAAPMAYGSSQARGQIGAAAAGLQHTATATPDPSAICDLHPQLAAMLDP